MKKRIQRIVRLLLADEHYVQPGLYGDELSAKERRQAKKAVEETMWAEIIMMRTVIKRYFGASKRREDATDAGVIAGDLRLLGISCLRLAKVMQVNQALQMAKNNGADETLNEAISKMLAEFGGEGGDGMLEVTHG